MADEPLVLTEDADGIRTLTLNRPDRYNAFNVPLIRTLRDSFSEAVDADDVEGIVLSGAGKAFCAGGDVKAMKEAVDDRGSAQELFLALTEHLHPLIESVRGSPKPVVGAIQGAVAGGGFGLALSCDWRVGTPETSFKPAYAKLGIVPDGGLTYFLPRIAGWGIANRIVMADAPVGSEDAYRWGLLDEVVASADVRTRAVARARRFADLPPATFAETKALLNQSLAHDLTSQLAEERRRNADSAGRPTLSEGLAAFFAKRDPDFRRTRD